MYIPDLGCDYVRTAYLNDDNKIVTPAIVKIEHPGAGPRHMEIHPSGKFTYVLNELGEHLSVF